ncbi:MAG: hypothetical protein HW397_543 [Dehalococcoidia bacterium]|nr:hypothetical protein [Dehalococcoidia bacterium]
MPEEQEQNVRGEAKSRGIAVLLLAAGESTRMGRSKQLLPWGGSTLLEYQVAQARSLSVAAEVVVVLGEGAEELRPLVSGSPNGGRGVPDVRVVVNAGYRMGKTSSILAGLRALRSDAQGVMVIGVDQPRPVSLLEALAEGFQAGSSLIAVPAYKGKRGHPPIFSISLLPELLAISEEREGLREIVQRHRSETQETEVDSQLVLTNLNTLMDYQRALALSTM